MSFRFSRANKDINHAPIQSGLEGAGYSTADSSMVGKSFPDLIASDERNAVIFEVKTEDGFFSIAQLEFLATWRGWSAFVSTPEMAIQTMKEPEKYCLTKKEKAAILQIVHRFRANTKDRHPRIRVRQFEKSLAEMLNK
jgi:hypothetical protein